MTMYNIGEVVLDLFSWFTGISRTDYATICAFCAIVGLIIFVARR